MKRIKRLSSLVLVIVLAMMFCACEKNETGMPYGVYKSDVGTIRFEDNKIYFEDMDEEFLLERKVSSLLAQVWVERNDEGEPLTNEEGDKMREEYYKTIDVAEYINKEFSYKYEKIDEEYVVYFDLYEGEDWVFSLYYYMEGQYIEFGDKEFRTE